MANAAVIWIRVTNRLVSHVCQEKVGPVIQKLLLNLKLVLRASREIQLSKQPKPTRLVPFSVKFVSTFDVKNKLVTEIWADSPILVECPLLPCLSMFNPQCYFSSRCISASNHIKTGIIYLDVWHKKIMVFYCLGRDTFIVKYKNQATASGSRPCTYTWCWSEQDCAYRHPLSSTIAGNCSYLHISVHLQAGDTMGILPLQVTSHMECMCFVDIQI